MYVRENARVNGKPTVISQVYLGSPERLAELDKQNVTTGEFKLKAEEFGALWIASLLSNDLDVEKFDADCLLFDTTNNSTYFAEDLVAIPLERFDPVPTRKNKELEERGEPDERVLAYHTVGEYWGKERTVIVTFNPSSARKQNYTFDGKLDALREELLEMWIKARGTGSTAAQSGDDTRALPANL